MAESARFDLNGRLKIDADEVSGALGDSLTVLPIVVALAALTPLSLPSVLLWFGVFQVVWGVVYGVPLSIEPMKALAGLAIAGTLPYESFLLAGLLVGAVLLVAGRAGLLAALARRVGTPAIRGVQLAVAFLLAIRAVELASAAPTLAAAATVLGGVVLLAGYGRAAPLAVLAAGVAIAVVGVGVPTPTLPTVAVVSGLLTLSAPLAVVEAALGQLAMSVGNAAVATAALCATLFDRDVSPDRLGESMGLTTLVAVPLGGVPMCHGSGGLAGKHAFGARTGGANLVLGVLYVVGAAFAGVVGAFPTAVLGVLLAAVAVHLGRAALEDVEGRERTATLLAGLCGPLASVGLSFVVGVAASVLLDRIGDDRTEA
jgi:hypothetical protein